MKGRNQVRQKSVFISDMCENSHFSSHRFYCVSAVVKFGIDRNAIVLGRILGEGFFGEVYDGVYKKAVSLSMVSKK